MLYRESFCKNEMGELVGLEYYFLKNIKDSAYFIHVYTHISKEYSQTRNRQVAIFQLSKHQGKEIYFILDVFFRFHYSVKREKNAWMVGI